MKIVSIETKRRKMDAKLLQCPLFDGVPVERMEAHMGECEKRELNKGERLSVNGVMGIVLKGSARIEKRSADDHAVILQHLVPPQPFGVAALFLEGENLSDLVAQQPVEILLFPKRTVLALLQREPRFCENYIGFLSGRIAFLNRKIEGFTGYHAKSRLLRFLEEQAREEGGCRVVRISSYKALADQLNVGRASLYRALDALKEEGLLRSEGRALYLNDERKGDNPF